MVKTASDNEVLAVSNRLFGRDDTKIDDREAVETKITNTMKRNYGSLLKDPGVLGAIGGGLGSAISVLQSKKIAAKSKDLSTTEHHINLRCSQCTYYAKTTSDFLKLARLRCPIDGSVLKTKHERGETRGRS